MKELSITIHLEKLLQGAGATDQAEPPKFKVEAVAEDGSSRIEEYKFMSVIRKEIATELP
jgi:hypothetical protein